MRTDPIVAVTNEAFASMDELFAFCQRHACNAVEYTFDRNALWPEEIKGELPALGRVQAQGKAIRSHLAYRGAEIADADAAKAGRALDLFRSSLTQAAEFGIDTASVHIGLGRDSGRGLNHRIAVDNLGALVEHGKKIGIRVCLENLRLGWTSDLATYRGLLEASGAWATIDLGHITACECESGTEGLALEFLSSVGERVLGAHVYGIEAVDPATGRVRHLPPRDLELIAPLLKGLFTLTPCDWWLIELHDAAEVEATLPLIRGFLDSLSATGEEKK